jgi:hypothetical protein
MRVRTGFATPAGNTFADDDWQHAKGGNWIGPLPAKNGVERETQNWIGPESNQSNASGEYSDRNADNRFQRRSGNTEIFHPAAATCLQDAIQLLGHDGFVKARINLMRLSCLDVSKNLRPTLGGAREWVTEKIRSSITVIAVISQLGAGNLLMTWAATSKSPSF